MRRTMVLFGVLIASYGCRDPGVKAIESKCDASLRQRAEGMARAEDVTPLDVLGKADGPIDDSRRRQLTEAGADLGTVTDELFTARIPAHKLGSVARLGFVKSLQLSQEREPLKP